jgi:hypothetical protein
VDNVRHRNIKQTNPSKLLLDKGISYSIKFDTGSMGLAKKALIHPDRKGTSFQYDVPEPIVGVV